MRCTSCIEGEEMQIADCAATADTQCETCTVAEDCPTSFYLVGECTLMGTNPVCTACRRGDECGAGTFLSGTCGGRSNPSCEACHPSCETCTGATTADCTSCSGQLVLQREGLSITGQCTSECAAGTAANEENVCVACSGSCLECSSPQDASSCTACASGAYLTAAGSCVAVCPAGTYANAAEGRCLTCSACTVAEFEDRACSADVDRVCVTYTDCAAGFEVETPPTPTSDRVCTPCTVGSYQPKQNQLDCISWTTCDAASEYMSQAGTVTSDRICTSLTQCVCTSEYESQAPTDTSDRKCTALQPCGSSTYQSAPLSCDAPRQCNALTVCNFPEQYETRAPTDTSDRQCAAVSPECQVRVGGGDGVGAEVEKESVMFYF